MSLDDELSDITDNRVVAMAKYVLMTLNTKSDKWIKMYSIEANANLIHQFLNKCEIRMLIFTLSSTGVFQVLSKWPAVVSTKSCYFIRKFDQPISQTDSLLESFICSDLSHSPLDYMSVFYNEVMLPIITNKKNHTNWPSVVSEDIIQASYSLKRNIDLSMGEILGKTVLPIPPNFVDIEKISKEFLKEFYDLLHR
eukprot:XP_014786058.1 PREDICTED: dynein beta chain, ciliary-like [Octopus bimaculoides]